MNHIRQYENYKPEIQTGDYILIQITSDNKIYEKFINNNIGQLIFIVPYNKDSYYIRYENIPLNLKSWFHTKNSSILHPELDLENTECFNKNSVNIIDYSKSKSDLEYILNAEKYNL
jgi:hypothetical protein